MSEDNRRRAEPTTADFLVNPQRSSSFCVSGEDLQSGLAYDITGALSSGSLEALDFRQFFDVPSESPSIRQHAVYCCYRSEESALGVIAWLEGNSSPPLDLIRTWSALYDLAHTFQQPRDTPKLDYAYISHPEYLQSPDLLSVLCIWTVLSTLGKFQSIHLVLDLLALEWDVLLPLTKAPETDVPVNLKAIQEFLLDPAKSDAELFNMLKDLDLARGCSVFKQESEQDHLYEHKYGLLCPRLFIMHMILEWIRKAPAPPPELLRSWEQQKNAVEECYARLREMNIDNESSGADSDSGTDSQAVSGSVSEGSDSDESD
ncbi:hypothetical protein FB45DRAFT_865103 [Roridomyces roridus]|uniref:Uncharacterized protein n=1 Tax=Roridomyces roridus TaxID=1738132 RepID=A0AAD7BYM5_9AGAR|nr:hypothetical protein FB45DRAFT_865103 [Roridomyces roridus]